VRLEIDGESAVNSPLGNDIRETLQRLSPSGPQWAVLDIRSNYYIQTRAVEDERFIVEYREGGPDLHYRAGGTQPREAVLNAFLDYLASGNRWRTAFEWRRTETT
jgi:hypothetical protein